MYHLNKLCFVEGMPNWQIQCQKWSLGSLLETYLTKVVVSFFPLLFFFTGHKDQVLGVEINPCLVQI